MKNVTLLKPNSFNCLDGRYVGQSHILFRFWNIEAKCIYFKESLVQKKNKIRKKKKKVLSFESSEKLLPGIIMSEKPSFLVIHTPRVKRPMYSRLSWSMSPWRSCRATAKPKIWDNDNIQTLNITCCILTQPQHCLG